MNKIRKGVVVAAGLGTRLQDLGEGQVEVLKPLYRLDDKPLLDYVLDGAAAGGLEEVVVVTGFRSEVLESHLMRRSAAPAVRTAYNPDYRLSNGVSLLCGARELDEDFVLLMSDHLFPPATLKRLVERGLGDDLACLAVDRKIDQVFDLDDATKVQLGEDGRIADIGKTLSEYNAIDTGMFLIRQELMDFLEGVLRERGDASISEAMQEAIGRERMGAMDILDAAWQDVDTPEMYEEARRQLRAGVYS